MLAFALAACTHDDPRDPPDADRFPDGFRWGTATAGFQVDMGCPTLPDDACLDRASDWYQWVTDPAIVGDPGLFVSGDDLADGPGLWELFEDDLDRMVADGHTAYRMSIEWSRLFPDPAAEGAEDVDALADLAEPAAVARYHEMFRALRDRGLEPVVTVNHYTLPVWVHDGVACHADIAGCPADGWVTEARIVPLIARYAGYVGREFGGEVDLWMTLNEPFATTASGYLLPGEDRSGPPGLSLSTDAALAVMRNQVIGHAAMYDAIHAEDPTAEVGLVMNFVALAPKDPARELDLRGAEHMDYLYHRLYLDALTTGAWDDDLDGVPDRTRDDLRGRLDVLGVNYYNRVFVSGLPFPLAPEAPAFDFLPEFSWEPYEDGLREVLGKAGEYGVPVWVTENGTPLVEEDGVGILERHVGAMHAAIGDGVDVRGYLYWSWVDNYEWNHGYGLRFGLYTYDPVSKARAPRPVAGRLRDYATRNHL